MTADEPSKSVKKRKIPVSKRKYRPNLEELPAFSMSKEATPINILELSKSIHLSIQADYYDEIYAIIPIIESLSVKSCIIYRETAQLVDATPAYIAKNLLKIFENFEYDQYTHTFNELLCSKKRMIPIAIKDYSLFPTGGVTNNDTFWINPGRIEELHNLHSKTNIILENLFCLEVDRKKSAIQRCMEKAFIAHAIIKREHDFGNTRPHISVLEFLNVSSSIETRFILKNLQFQHIPGYPNEFRTLYDNYQKNIYQEAGRKHLNKLLNIEF